jgi:acyl-CoA reductase-like NAD-dependent aldehyde dehydrogenase
MLDKTKTWSKICAPITADFVLEAIATQILALGDSVIERAVAETGLPRGRIEGERGRTIGELRLFASVVRDGHWLGARVDPAQPDRKPMARSDLRLRNIALGPVAMFGASNFPLAFSVAGGDTASALAAGSPVVVNAHSAHPGTSKVVGEAITAAVAECGLPEGVFALLLGNSRWLGGALVADAARTLLPTLERKAGRLLVNGWPTSLGEAWRGRCKRARGRARLGRDVPMLNTPDNGE